MKWDVDDSYIAVIVRPVQWMAQEVLCKPIDLRLVDFLCVNASYMAFFFFQAEDGIRDATVTGGSDVCSSDLLRWQRAFWKPLPMSSASRNLLCLSKPFNKPPF